MSSEKQGNENDQRLIAEYHAAQEVFLHHDSLSWQVCSVLTGGAFVFWGLLLASDLCAQQMVIACTIVALLMSAWILYAGQNQQIYLYKLHRLWEIEKTLGLKQHWRFSELAPAGQRLYVVRRPSGHFLNASVYVLASLGAVPFILSQHWGDWTLLGLLAPLCIVVCSLAWVRCSRKKTKSKIEKLWRARKMAFPEARPAAP